MENRVQYAVLAWGGATSNPAREFVQMVGRVRKVRDRTVHIYLASTRRGAACTRESILEAMEHSWASLNSGNVLAPAMRQLLVDDSGVAYSKCHEPIYQEL